MQKPLAGGVRAPRNGVTTNRLMRVLIRRFQMGSRIRSSKLRTTGLGRFSRVRLEGRRGDQSSLPPIDPRVIDFHEGAVDGTGDLAAPGDDGEAEPDGGGAVAEFVFLAAELLAVEVEDPLLPGSLDSVGVEVAGEAVLTVEGG